MGKKNKQKAKRMAAKGKSAAQIKAKTGVGGSSAQRYVAKRAPAPSRSSSSSRSSSLSKAVKSAGPVLSNKEAKKIAKSTGKSVAQVVAKATSKGTSLGSNLTNKVSKASAAPGGSLAQSLGITRANPKTLEALRPLQNLQLNKGTVYSGYSTSTGPSRTTQFPNGRVTQQTSTTNYNPIVLPRGVGGVGGGGSGRGGGGGGGGNGKTKNNGEFDNIKALYDEQIAAARAEMDSYASKAAEQIETLELDFADQLAAAEAANADEINYLNDLMLMQQQDSQAQLDFMQQQAQAAEAAYAEQARQASALATAYVPEAAKSAATAYLGDQRKTNREEENNSLSSLAIVSGLGTNANPLAGMQLA